MDPPRRSTPHRPGARRAPARSRRELRNWLDVLVHRGQGAAAVLLLVASTIIAGPASSSTAGISGIPGRTAGESPTVITLQDAERELWSRLALGYAGVLSAADAEALVREVGRQQRVNSAPSDQLLQTMEAVSRRALTDFLTRGTPLPYS